MLKITPQTVLFNDEDFHSVKILETVVRQSEVLAHRKKLLFCKVVEQKSKLSKIFPQPPMVAFKQPNSLRNLLVRAEISKPNTTIGKSHTPVETNAANVVDKMN
jgi:hypothetical protein